MKKLLLVTILIIFGLGNSLARSSQWPSVRKEFLKTHPVCAVCGSRSDLEVHHIIPYHFQPDLELDPNNLITLCKSKNWGFSCHLKVGHGGNYKWENPWVFHDARKIHSIGSRKGCFSDKECIKELEDYIKLIQTKVKDFNKTRTHK